MSQKTHELYYDIHIPDTGDAFERLAQKVCARRYGESFARYGRSGQNQSGIDLFNEDFSICVQCKNYQGHDAAQRLRGGLEKDFLSAVKKFGDSMQKYVLATTVQRDTHVQDLVADLSRRYPEVTIQVLFWDDFKEILQKNPKLLEEVGRTSLEEKKLRELSEALFEALYEFRCRIKKNDIRGGNAALSITADIARSIYALGVHYKHANPNVYDKCTKLVHQYNTFLDATRALRDAQRNGNSSRVEELALCADQELVNILVLAGKGNNGSGYEVEQKFRDLLELMQERLFEFFNGVMSDDEVIMSDALEKVRNAANEMNELMDRYGWFYPELSRKSDEVVDQFNIFRDALHDYVTDDSDDNSPRAEELLMQIEVEYRKLHKLVQTYLQ